VKQENYHPVNQNQASRAALAEAPLFICRSRSYLDWLPIVLVMGMVWRRRWWRFIIGGINRPLIFMAIFAWNIGSSSATEGYLEFLIPGLVVMSAVSASYTDLVGWFTQRRVYRRELDEYLLAPISNTSLLVGHVLGGGGKGFLVSLLVFLIAHFFVKEFSFSLFLLLQLLIVCLAFASLAVAVAMVAGGDKEMLMFSNLIIFPMTFFCGTFFPVEQLPGLFAAFSWGLPLTAATYNLRALALTGVNHLPWLAQSTGWLVVLYWAAYLLLKIKRED
jgi:ABC-type polysaccharide/polyol phosphate export permease